MAHTDPGTAVTEIVAARGGAVNGAHGGRMARCRAWLLDTAGGLFCYGLLVLAWLLIRCGVAPTEPSDLAPASHKARRGSGEHRMQRHDLSLIRRPAGLAMGKAARAPTAYIPRFRERMMETADQPYRMVALLAQLRAGQAEQTALLREILTVVHDVARRSPD